MHIDRDLREQTLKNRNSRSDLHVTKLPLTMTRRDKPAGRAKSAIGAGGSLCRLTVTNLSNRAFVLTQLVSENFSSHFLNADIHYVRICVMSNENLEKAGFYAKTAEPRITGPLPHWYYTVLREVMITIGGVAAAKILSSRLFWRA
ncbi:hypothetical protein DER46DRAFT_576803 [Fusarium sp. MPI-SDFR-AT-0072]|nr:hypothetical protein DER46DRAFT_576803 [Fusarium sp. MPI-SDFR-AT-0072]